MSRDLLLPVCLLACLASKTFGQRNSQENSSIYRGTYPCEERDASSICIVGTISKGMALTLVTRDQAVGRQADTRAA
jgi:hypothetical protein